MAVVPKIVELQSVAVEGISGPNGADRMYITTGVARFTAPGPAGDVYATLLEPTLEPGQFRRAIATASAEAAGGPFTIADVQADWDDESGMVELRFTAQYDVTAIAFNVLTFAAAPSA